MQEKNPEQMRKKLKALAKLQLMMNEKKRTEEQKNPNSNPSK